MVKFAFLAVPKDSLNLRSFGQNMDKLEQFFTIRHIRFKEHFILLVSTSQGDPEYFAFRLGLTTMTAEQVAIHDPRFFSECCQLADFRTFFGLKSPCSSSL